MHTITRSSARAVFEMLPSGVLAVRFTGTLTRSALGYFKAEAQARRCEGGPGVRALVADFRAAVVALTEEDLRKLLDGEADESPARTPTALLTQGELVDMFTQHAARMALRGIRRRVFVSPDHALQWAQRLAGQPAAL